MPSFDCFGRRLPSSTSADVFIEFSQRVPRQRAHQVRRSLGLLILAPAFLCLFPDVGRWRPMLPDRGLAALALLDVAAPKPWKVGSWNQHRKSSYFQKDCIWIPKLLDGNAKSAVFDAISKSEVTYSPMEIQLWAKSCDLVGVQEADPLFTDALGPDLREFVVQGDNDRDGRGMIVESASAALLPPDIRELRREVATVGFLISRGKRVCRNFVVILLERKSDGQQLVFSSIHLHPPSQMSSSYFEYLEPLKQAITTLSTPNLDGKLSIPVLLVGDFNVEPEEFVSMTDDDEVWQQLRPVPVEGGCTAHCTNPSERGDFALSSGGQWTGRALGDSGFGAYERFADEYTNSLSSSICLGRAAKHLTDAGNACDTVLGGSTSMPALRSAKTAVHHELQRAARAQHRKGIFTSDHRPISFHGILSESVQAS